MCWAEYRPGWMSGVLDGKEDMQIRILKSLALDSGLLADAALQAREEGYDGVEFRALGDEEGLEWDAVGMPEGFLHVAVVYTGGGEYPDPGLSIGGHLDSLEREIERVLPMKPFFFNCVAGSSAWTPGQNVEFFAKALELARKMGVEVTFETHLCRSLFDPWITRDLLLNLPELRMTADFAYWCELCHALVMSRELDLLYLCASRTRHVHARIGQYRELPLAGVGGDDEDGGDLPEYERWWQAVWLSHLERDYAFTTLTPVHGRNGPVGDVHAQWMADRERNRFREFLAGCRPLRDAG